MSREQGLADVLQAIYENPTVPRWLRAAAADAVQVSPDDAARFIRGAWGQKRAPIAFPAEAHVIMLENMVGAGGTSGPIFMETEFLREPDSLTLQGAMVRAAHVARGARWLVCKVTPVAASGPEGWQVVGEEGAAEPEVPFLYQHALSELQLLGYTVAEGDLVPPPEGLPVRQIAAPVVTPPSGHGPESRL